MKGDLHENKQTNKQSMGLQGSGDSNCPGKAQPEPPGLPQGPEEGLGPSPSAPANQPAAPQQGMGLKPHLATLLPQGGAPVCTLSRSLQGPDRSVPLNPSDAGPGVWAERRKPALERGGRKKGAPGRPRSHTWPQVSTGPARPSTGHARAPQAKPPLARLRRGRFAQGWWTTTEFRWGSRPPGPPAPPARSRAPGCRRGLTGASPLL